jgi:hypothetical protein
MPDLGRRGFLGLVGAAIAAPFVPTPVEPPLLGRSPIEALQRATFDRAAIARAFNVPAHMLVSEELLQDFSTARARERAVLIDWQRNLYLAEDRAFAEGPA